MSILIIKLYFTLITEPNQLCNEIIFENSHLKITLIFTYKINSSKENRF